MLLWEIPSFLPSILSHLLIFNCICLLQVVWSVAVGDTFLSSLHPFTSVDIYLCMCLLQVIWSVAVGDIYLCMCLLQVVWSVAVGDI